MAVPTSASARVGTSHPHFDAVICDIDGCLGPETTAPFDTPRLAELAAYNRAASDRHDRPVLTLCSGRPQPFAECLARVLAGTLPSIAENGVWLFDPADNSFQRDPAITPAHLHAVHEMTEWIEDQLVPQGVIIQPGKTASISLWHADTAWLKRLMPELESRCREQRWPMRISSTINWINCDLAHVSKGTGIDRFFARTGLSRPRVAGIGDRMSDLPIAERSAFFACPANAEDALKAHAHYVARAPEIEGVIEILSYIASDRFTSPSR